MAVTTEVEKSDFEKCKDRLKETSESILEELKGRQSKASYKRVRKATLDMNRVGKEFRSLSTSEE